MPDVEVQVQVVIIDQPWPVQAQWAFGHPVAQLGQFPESASDDVADRLEGETGCLARVADRQGADVHVPCRRLGEPERRVHAGHAGHGARVGQPGPGPGANPEHSFIALSQAPGSTPAGGPSTMAAPPESVTPWDVRHSDRPPCSVRSAGLDGAGVGGVVAAGDAAVVDVAAGDDRSGSGDDVFEEHAPSSAVAARMMQALATVGIRVIR